MDNETVGISTIIVGLVIVIGAVRGTWKRIFQDVVQNQSGASSSSSASGSASSSGPKRDALGNPISPVSPNDNPGGFGALCDWNGIPIPCVTFASPTEATGVRPTVLA